MLSDAQDAANDLPGVGRRTDVSSAGAQGVGPHLFISTTMGADQRCSRKIVRQTLHFGKRGLFNIQNSDAGPVLGDGGPHLTQGIYLVD